MCTPKNRHCCPSVTLAVEVKWLTLHTGAGKYIGKLLGDALVTFLLYYSPPDCIIYSYTQSILP